MMDGERGSMHDSAVDAKASQDRMLADGMTESA